MNRLTIRIFTLILILCASIKTISAQTNFQNISSTNVDELSDQQIAQLKQQVQSSGLTESQLLKEAQNKGLSNSQLTKLQNRLSSSRPDASQNDLVGADMSRKLNYRQESDNNPGTKSTGLRSRIFGADIFDSKNKTFEPNLKLATPLNYILGPEDQLNINVFGNNIVNWKLEVSPEGDINIPGVGILNLAGKTIEQATSAIKGRLIAHKYTIGHGTNVQVTLGNIRSIKVIIIGQVMKPGTFTLPSLATVFNALYSAGGATENGSLRQIEIIRDNKILKHLDIYDFLTKGDQKNNITLKDQDIIRVPTYRTRVELDGQVKIPALFEVLPGESLKKVLEFAGGFSDDAYTSKIKVSQISDQQRKITDVFEADYANYSPLRGDKYVVESIINRFENKVVINGAVFKPGEYELQNGMTLAYLIVKAAGLKEDAFTERGTITRLKSDNSIEIIGFNVKDIVDKTKSIILQREDQIDITSKFDLRDKYTVTINGNIRNPGSFMYGDNLKLEDLLLRAGGFSEGASTNRIEVARRVLKNASGSDTSAVSKIFIVNMEGPLKPGISDFALSPFDIINVYSLPGYKKQRTVKIEGEVMYPGYYTISFKKEKVSDLILRAGGLTTDANINGGSLKRDNLAILGIDKNKFDVESIVKEREIEEERLKRTYKDSSNFVNRSIRNNYVGIDLKKILRSPGSKIDISLEEGDVITVPKIEQIVRINGQVLFPSAVIFNRSNSFNDFISGAGGYGPDASKNGAYIVYANGAVKASHRFLFIQTHPRVEPGSEIFVPKKAGRHGLSTIELLALTSGIASITGIILTIIGLHK